MTDVARAILVGESAAMACVRRRVQLAARGATSVLIEGETGTGKELVAALVHESSGRVGRLVAVNVAAIPGSIFEAALFGHKRGSFTGAIRDEPGHVRSAHRGTLFLDEIGSLGLEGQAKLLRVLESGRVMAIGASSEVSIDFRVVAATNSDLESMVRIGKFRADLYYRLCEWRIAVPALRDRVDDIEVLARHFLAEWNAGQLDVAMSASAIAALKSGAWPGNVRQLRQTIRRAAILAEGRTISGAIAEEAMSNGSRQGSVGRRSNTAAAQVLRLMEVMNEVNWDVAMAALRLEVTKKTVYARLQRYDVAIPDSYRRRSAYGS